MPGHFSESNRISAEASSTLGWRRSSNKRSKTPARYSGNLQRLSQEKCYAPHSFDRGDSGHCGPDAIPAGNRQAIERTRLGFAAPAEHAIPRRTRIDRHLCLCGKRLLFLPDSTRRGGGAPLRRGRRLGAQNQDQSGNGSGFCEAESASQNCRYSAKGWKVSVGGGYRAGAAIGRDRLRDPRHCTQTDWRRGHPTIQTCTGRKARGLLGKDM